MNNQLGEKGNQDLGHFLFHIAINTFGINVQMWENRQISYAELQIHLYVISPQGGVT